MVRSWVWGACISSKTKAYRGFFPGTAHTRISDGTRLMSKVLDVSDRSEMEFYQYFSEELQKSDIRSYSIPFYSFLKIPETEGVIVALPFLFHWDEPCFEIISWSRRFFSADIRGVYFRSTPLLIPSWYVCRVLNLHITSISPTSEPRYNSPLSSAWEDLTSCSLYFMTCAKTTKENGRPWAKSLLDLMSLSWWKLRTSVTEVDEHRIVKMRRFPVQWTKQVFRIVKRITAMLRFLSTSA